MLIKSGVRAPVDSMFLESSSYHVYENGSDVWDCMLNQTNMSEIIINTI